MRKIILTLLIICLFPVAAQAHGGGCRKANLPRCCHMDNSVGSVHCH